MLGIRKSALSYHEYYFYYKVNNETATDEEMADLVGFDLNDYRELMKRNFRGVYRRTLGITCFPTYQDADKALSYLLG